MKLLNMAIPPKASFDSKISDILHRVEYRHLKNGVRDLIERFQDALSQFFRKAFEKASLSIEPEISDRLAVIFIILGLVVIVAIIILIIVRTSKAFEKRSKLKVILGERIGDKTTPDSLRQKARTFIENGDFRQAIRYDFIAILFLMHEKRLIYIDETKTNQEIYNYLKKTNFKLLQVFQNMISVFDSAWYGHKESDAGIYNAWGQDLKLLWNEVISFEAKNK